MASAPKTETIPSPEPQPTKYSLRDYLVGLFVVSLVVRALAAGCSREPTRSPSPPPPAYSQPAPPGAPRPAGRVDRPFTASEVQAFKDYEWRVEVQGAKWTDLPPLGYERWVERGRPAPNATP